MPSKSSYTTSRGTPRASCRRPLPMVSRPRRWPTAQARRSTSSPSTRPLPRATSSLGVLLPRTSAPSSRPATGSRAPRLARNSPTNPFDPFDTGGTFNQCAGPYENAGPPDSTTAEAGDALCYNAGDTHPGYDGPGTSTPPDEATGCQDNVFQNGDLDFDGQPYYPDWPTGNRPTKFPSTFVEQFPTTNGQHQYPQFFIQTDLALSETSCLGNTVGTGGGTSSGCTVPPSGPGNFYPYWTEIHGRRTARWSSAT